MRMTAGDWKGDTARGARYLAERNARMWDRIGRQKPFQIKEKDMAKGAGIMKPLKASAELREIVKEKKVSRGQAVQLLWKYIKKKGLQDKKNKRVIVLDKRLRPLFEVNKKLRKMIAKKRTIEMRGKEIKIPADAIFMTEIGGMLKKHLS